VAAGLEAGETALPDWTGPRAPWLGPDLQTLRNTLRRPRESALPTGERLDLPMADGDELSGLLHRGDGRHAMVVLIHGLSGCEGSAYVIASTRHLLARGHHVLRVNLRGAGPTRARCRGQYYAGRSQDLREVVAQLPADLVGHGLVIVGYSLGGNMLLKYLGEEGATAPVTAAVSVSAPIDLAATLRRMLAPRNRLYHAYILGGMKREALGEGAELTPEERAAIRAARTVYDYDEGFIAGRAGCAGAWDYYERNKALRFMSGIRVPTLVVHALDDPWIPADAYTGFDWAGTPALEPLLSPGGGHVGFHERASRVPWHDRAITTWLGGSDLA
jgi:predicted alpha/beta-fold hydrolase